MDAAGSLLDRRHNSKHKWSTAEHELLGAAIQAALASGSIKWPEIAKALGTGRSAKQCRERWLNTRPDAKKGLWSVEEEETLAAKHAEIGPQWGRLLSATQSERSADAIKNHFNALLRCKRLDSRVETILTVYVCLLKYGAPANKAYGYAKQLREKRENMDSSVCGSMTAAVKELLHEKGEYAPTTYARSDEEYAALRPATNDTRAPMAQLGRQPTSLLTATQASKSEGTDVTRDKAPSDLHWQMAPPQAQKRPLLQVPSSEDGYPDSRRGGGDARDSRDSSATRAAAGLLGTTPQTGSPGTPQLAPTGATHPRVVGALEMAGGSDNGGRRLSEMGAGKFAAKAQGGGGSGGSAPRVMTSALQVFAPAQRGAASPAKPQPAVAQPPQASRAQILCHCGDAVLTSMSMLPDTAGQLYYTCAKSPKDESRCRFLLWGAMDVEAEGGLRRLRSIAVTAPADETTVEERNSKRPRLVTLLDVPEVTPPGNPGAAHPAPKRAAHHEQANGGRALLRSPSGVSQRAGEVKQDESPVWSQSHSGQQQAAPVFEIQTTNSGSQMAAWEVQAGAWPTSDAPTVQFVAPAIDPAMAGDVNTIPVQYVTLPPGMGPNQGVPLHIPSWGGGTTITYSMPSMPVNTQYMYMPPHQFIQ